MKNIILIISAIVSICSQSPAYAETDLAQQRAMAFQLAPIKSSNDLKNYLATTPLKKTPLNVLPKTEQSNFLKSLTFNENGLTGFNFQILKDNLSVSQTYKILSLFGAQHLAQSISNGKLDVQSNSARPSMISSSHTDPKIGNSPTTQN